MGNWASNLRFGNQSVQPACRVVANLALRFRDSPATDNANLEECGTSGRPSQWRRLSSKSEPREAKFGQNSGRPPFGLRGPQSSDRLCG